MSSRDYRIQQQEAYVNSKFSAIRNNPASSGLSDYQIRGRLRADHHGLSSSSNDYVCSNQWDNIKNSR
jgi:hypothetical protein